MATGTKKKQPTFSNGLLRGSYFPQVPSEKNMCVSDMRCRLCQGVRETSHHILGECETDHHHVNETSDAM